MSNPNLFIAGFAKSGTTSLYHYFVKHPEVFCNKYLKEPRYFSYEYFLETPAYSYILKNAIKTEKAYEKLYEEATTEKYIVDGSVYYTCFKGVAEKIKTVSKNAKVILIIRNPIERFISHYHMHLRNEGKNETIEEFMANPLSAEGINLLSIGFYYEKIKEYYDVFGIKNVHVTLFDNLINDPSKFYFEICKFLGISYIKDTNNQMNATKLSRSKIIVAIFMWLKKIVPRKIILLFSVQQREAINNLLYKKSRKNNKKYSEKIIKELTNYYKKDVLKTKELLNIDLSNWLEK